MATLRPASTAAIAQAPPGDVFRSTSTIVTVPALVRDPSGKFVTDLTAGGFALSDDGVRQAVAMGKADREPVALVVLVQTGGRASRHFVDYTDLPSFLDGLAAGTPHELMLITFDSHVETIWHFPTRSDGVAHALTHLRAGDSGAAIRDAVTFAVEQLQSEPGNFRRIVLLVSQERDDGSTAPPQDVLRTLGKGSTAIYSLTFPASKQRTRVAPSRHNGDPGPLAATFDELDKRTASELTTYTGGAQFLFATRSDFNQAAQAVSADIRNRYALSFQPSAHRPGFHQLRVGAGKGLSATARGGYWFDPLPGDR